MFDAHVPDAYREHAPRVVDEADGSQQWYYGDIRGRNLGLNAVAGKSPEFFNVDPLRYEHMRPGCYDVHERVRDMSAGGQLAGLNFPNWTGFSGQVLNQGPDRDINLVMIKAYNDWHVDEWCGAYPERFIPVRHPPAVRRARSRARSASPRGQGLSRGDVLGEPGRASACRASTPTRGTRCSRRAARRGPCCAATSVRRRRARRRRPTRPRRCR